MTTASKIQLRHFFESRAPEAEAWRARNPYYYRWLSDLLRFFIPPSRSVLEVGSGLGDLLAAVRPSAGVGIDLSPAMAASAARRHPQPHLRFTTGDIDQGASLREPFDFIIASDLVGYLDDIQTALQNLRSLCHERTRLVVTQYNRAWEPILRLGTRLGLNQPKPMNNWISAHALAALLEVAGFEVVSRGTTFLCPKRIAGAGDWLNRTVARLPAVRRLGLIQYFIARPRLASPIRRFAVSVIVTGVTAPGVVANVSQRIPSLGSRTEIIFTCTPRDLAVMDAVAQAQARSPARQLGVCAVAPGQAWGGVVASALAQATGDLVMLLGSDTTIAPEELEKFYQVIAEGKADALVGTRLVYPNAADGGLARRGYHRWCGRILSWVIRQPVSDPLCPMLAWRRDHRLPPDPRLASASEPAGRLALLLSAAKQGQKIAEIPVHYQADGVLPGTEPDSGPPRLVRICGYCLRWYPY